MREKVIYTWTWFKQCLWRFCKLFARSTAYGLLMFVGCACLVGMPWLFQWDSPGLWSVIIGFVIGFFLSVAFWWAALSVAEETVPGGDVVDSNLLRSSRLKKLLLHDYLKKNKDRASNALVLSKDIHQAAHQMIDQADETTVRLCVAAMLEGATRHKTISVEAKELTSHEKQQQPAD